MGRRKVIQNLVVCILDRASKPNCFYSIQNKIIKQYGTRADDVTLSRAIEYLVKCKIIDRVWVDDFAGDIRVGKTAHYII